MANWKPFENLRSKIKYILNEKDTLVEHLSNEAISLSANGLWGKSLTTGTSRSTIRALFERSDFSKMPFGYDAVIATVAWKLIFPDTKPSIAEIEKKLNIQDLHSNQFFGIVRDLYPQDKSHFGIWQTIKIANNTEFHDDQDTPSTEELRSSLTVIHYDLREGLNTCCLLLGRRSDWKGGVNLYRTKEGNSYLDIYGEREREPVRQIFHYNEGRILQGLNLGVAHVAGDESSPIAATRLIMRRSPVLTAYYLLNFSNLRTSTDDNLVDRDSDNRSLLSNYIFNVESDNNMSGYARTEPSIAQNTLGTLSFRHNDIMELLKSKSRTFSSGGGILLDK
ncbi:hypothetical protein [Rhizobium sp. PP-CC-3G-465]|uniref:hypothetical protein n=1 Tax=Rhizobium sp. PP-CC-3G-465 TaxID=2135648 RepID=UPI001049BBEC|nr:hypothetical protein C8J33_11640 [Rhizobium sp. PP-CC-3G-465]